ncbi:MAG: DUF188 domain-containing protein [Spirochaetaceae bacterium]|jgi:uncharacterized protein YaiI (UPF0178 family)|nr:DUF188 domain-containing protein [Spirochaetaceae bacterium]
MKILIDADSCPAMVRDVILKAASRTNVAAIFTANRLIPGLWGNGVMELCSSEPGAADNRIVALSCNGDLAVTRDVPLAKRLVEKGIAVINDRGRVFTKENIGEYYSLRCFQVGIIETGAEIIREKTYNKRNLKNFSNGFDALLTKLLKYDLQLSKTKPFCSS